MSFPKKGPELKLSKLKVPDFIYDLYYDLKERHLLPVVALLLVAIVAMPIIIKSKQSEPEATEVAAIASSANGEEDLVVSHSNPQLRDPRRRLSHNRPLDPFSSKAPESSDPAEESSGSGTEGGSTPAEAAPVVEATVTGGEPSASPTESSSVSSPTEITVPSGGTTEASRGGKESSRGGNESSGGGPTRVRYASTAIDVRIVAVPTGSSPNTRKAKPKAEVRRNVAELTMLPSRSTPAVTFMGSSRDGKKALLLISSDVISAFGEGKCVVGSQSCQLMALETGLPETFVYGPQERTYRIELLKIAQTLSAKPRRASLGATGKGKKDSGGSKDSSASEEPAERGTGNSAAG